MNSCSQPGRHLSELSRRLGQLFDATAVAHKWRTNGRGRQTLRSTARRRRPAAEADKNKRKNISLQRNTDPNCWPGIWPRIAPRAAPWPDVARLNPVRIAGAACRCGAAAHDCGRFAAPRRNTFAPSRNARFASESPAASGARSASAFSIAGHEGWSALPLSPLRHTSSGGGRP